MKLTKWHPKHQKDAEPISQGPHAVPLRNDCKTVLILKTGGTWIAGVVGMAGVMGGLDKPCLDLRSLNTVLLLGAIPLDVRM